MKTAFIIFDRMTMLDFISIYDPLTRLKSMGLMPEFVWDICAMSKDVVDDKELCITSTVVGHSLSGYDLLVVPGGLGTRTLQYDEAFIDWLRTSEPVKLKTSVCTGALLLGAAGFLQHKRATTRVVDERDVVTARGVTSGIDLGLHLVERVAGAKTRTRIATQMDYPRQGYAG